MAVNEGGGFGSGTRDYEIAKSRFTNRNPALVLVCELVGSESPSTGI